MKPSRNIELPVVEERRSFLTTCISAIAGITVIGVVAPLVEACQPSQSIGPRILPPTNTDTTGSDPNAPAGTPFDISSLTVDGKALLTTSIGSDGKPVLLVRLSATDYRALSTLCTHSACQVDSHVPVNGPISCTCHGSKFNIDGSVKNGPATKPLKTYASTLDSTTQKLYVVIT